MSESNKMYILGYNEGIERAAQQCKFYTKACKETGASVDLEHMEELIRMLRISRAKEKESA